MGRLVDYSVGQRIVVQSTLHSGRATVWRFVQRSKENSRICIYRCSTCQADYNEVSSVFGIILPNPPEIRVIENGKMLDNPDSAKHFCCWETDEASEIGIIHARRLIFLLAQEIEDGFTQAALSKKLKEIKRHPLFDQIDSTQKSRAMALINDVTRETIIRLKEAGVDVLDDPPIYLPQPIVEHISPKVSRLRTCDCVSKFTAGGLFASAGELLNPEVDPPKENLCFLIGVVYPFTGERTSLFP